MLRKSIHPPWNQNFIKNLYFVGEVLDLDALTGGFNLQIAWSTGYLAGNQYIIKLLIKNT